jgi:hypothetical protein
LASLRREILTGCFSVMTAEISITRASSDLQRDDNIPIGLDRDSASAIWKIKSRDARCITGTADSPTRPSIFPADIAGRQSRRRRARKAQIAKRSDARGAQPERKKLKR